MVGEPDSRLARSSNARVRRKPKTRIAIDECAVLRAEIKAWGELEVEANPAKGRAAVIVFERREYIGRGSDIGRGFDEESSNADFGISRYTFAGWAFYRVGNCQLVSAAID